MGFPGGSDDKESAYNVGNLSSHRGSGKSSEEENGYPLQYSCLKNSMDRGAWWATVHGVIVFLYIRNEQLEFEMKNALWLTVTSANK